MSTAATTRTLTPGSTGWMAEDLNDPAIRRQWDDAHVELVHGVIAAMPAAYFDHSYPVTALMDLVRSHERERGRRVFTASDVDIVIDETTVYRADGVIATHDDLDRQREVQRQRGEESPRIGSFRVPPFVVIESVSRGHESQDWQVKRDDYAKLGVPNYWIISYAKGSLTCLRLEDGEYVTDAAGEENDTISPSAFDELSVNVKDLFVD